MDYIKCTFDFINLDLIKLLGFIELESFFWALSGIKTYYRVFSLLKGSSFLKKRLLLYPFQVIHFKRFSTFKNSLNENK